MNQLIYDIHSDDCKKPVWLIAPLREAPIHNNKVYINVLDYQSVYVGDFINDSMGCTVSNSELTTGRKYEEIGIDLLMVKQRIRPNFEEIDHFVILISDIIEIQSNSRYLFGDRPIFLA